MHLARFPRVRFAHLPTPLEPMPNLTRLLGGPQLYVKRDDCTGLATGGNKTRKLEFLIGEALAQGADTVITHGAVQSNHVRQTAAAACKYGLKCAALLERRSALAITVGENFRDPRIAIEALTSVEMIAVVAATHPLAQAGEGRMLTRSELAAYLQIVQIDPTPISGAQDFNVLSPQTCRVTGQDTKHEMILAGLKRYFVGTL